MTGLGFLVVLAVLFSFAFLYREKLALRGQRRFGTRAHDFIPSPEERLTLRRPKKRFTPFQPVEDPVPLYSHRSKFENEHCEICRRQPRIRFENPEGSALEFCVLHGVERQGALASKSFFITVDTR